MDLAPGLDQAAFGGDHGDDADELCLALAIGDGFHVFQQQLQAAPVVQGRIAAVAGGVHAGCAAQGIHADAGIIRQGGQARGFHDGLCLDEGILLKGGAVLLHIQINAQLRLEHQLEAELLGDLADLHQLVGILTC